MQREFCPKCQSLQNMNLSTHEALEKDAEDKGVKITTQNYHCSSCGTFVKSEETKTPAESENQE